MSLFTKQNDQTSFVSFRTFLVICEQHFRLLVPNPVWASHTWNLIENCQSSDDQLQHIIHRNGSNEIKLSYSTLKNQFPSALNFSMHFCQAPGSCLVLNQSYHNLVQFLLKTCMKQIFSIEIVLFNFQFIDFYSPSLNFNDKKLLLYLYSAKQIGSLKVTDVQFIQLHCTYAQQNDLLNNFNEFCTKCTSILKHDININLVLLLAKKLQKTTGINIGW